MNLLLRNISPRWGGYLEKALDGVRFPGVFLPFLFLTIFAGGLYAETDTMALMSLQMQAIQKQGEAAFALSGNNYDQALAAYQESASISKKFLSTWQGLPATQKQSLIPTAQTASSTLFNSFINMCYVYRMLQKYDEAESALSQASAISREKDEPQQKKQCLKEAAELKWARKSFIAASLLYEQILRDQESDIVKDKRWDVTPPGASPATESFTDSVSLVNEAITSWGTYVQLAGLYTYMFDQENALRIYRLPGFIKLRNWLQEKGRLSPALDTSSPFGILAWAANLFPSYYHIGKALVLNRVERYQESLTELASAAALIEGRPFPEARFALSTLRGYTLQKLGKIDEAVTSFREGLSQAASMPSGIREISECYSHLYLIDVLVEKGELDNAMKEISRAEELATKLQDPRQLWDVKYLKGKALQRQGHAEDALREYKEAITYLEQFRAQLSLERLRRDFMATKTKVYEAIIDLLLSLNRPDEAFSYVERAKARAFVDLFGNLEKSKILKPKDREKLQDKFRELEQNQRKLEESQDEIDRQLRGLPGTPADKRGISFVQKVSQQVAEHQKNEDQLVGMAGAEFATLATVQPVDLGALKDLLDETTAVAEYYRGNASDTVFVFGLDKTRMAGKTPLALRLSCSGSQLNLKVLNFRNSIEASTKEFSPELHEKARDLYHLLLEPLASLLAGKKRLVIIPHGNLSFLPFSMLEKSDGTAVLDQMETVYLPSANTLRFCRAKNSKKHDTLYAFAFGNSQVENLDPLPNTLTEVDDIGANFAAADRTILKDVSPTLSEFSTQASHRDVIHLATHGVLQPNQPLESSIMLGKTPVPVRDVMTLDLHAGLVTLSACQTGMGKLYEGDEIVGLTRAFMYAGTPSVLSSLWPVSDRSTAVLMTEFFKNFKGGKNKSQALREAQIAVRAQFPGPFHWASFVLTGDWE